jgi:deazaflavin-dependent oxidoreductase (nitroreductase family)
MHGHSDANLLRRAMRRSGEWKPLSRLYALALQPADELVRRATRGRTTPTEWVTGMPVVELTTTGAKSGRPRTLPLVAIPDGERLMVIASNFGQARNPAWYHNLRAHPEALAELDGARRRMVARELVGEERERWYERGIEIYPGWIEYRRRTAGIRAIPVIELRPLDPGPPSAG